MESNEDDLDTNNERTVDSEAIAELIAERTDIPNID